MKNKKNENYLFCHAINAFFGSSCGGQIWLTVFAAAHAACVIKNGMLKSKSLNLDRNLN